MNKIYSTFKDYKNDLVRIYTDGKGHFAEIYKMDAEYYGIYECDKYGFAKNDFKLTERSFARAKETMTENILNYL